LKCRDQGVNTFEKISHGLIIELVSTGDQSEACSLSIS
jgi:hypothetical protein